MELRHLRYFIAVAEEQNVSRAAARLHVSQPPLSRQIRNLERELGVPLFNRTPTAIKLTEAGKVFLIEARAVLQRVDDAIVLGQAAACGQVGQVRVGYAASPTVEVLPRALRIFKDTSPDISVQLRDMSSRAMLKGLHEGSLDVALIVSVTPSDFAAFEVEEIGSYPPCVATHLEHKFARRREVPLGEIAKEPFLAFTRQDHPEHHAFLAKIFGSEREIPSILEEFATVNSMIAAVQAGRGVAVVFGTISLVAGRRLALRPLTPDPGRFPIALAYRKEGATAASLAFVEATRRAKPRRS